MPKKISLGIIGGGFGKRVLLPVCLQHPKLLVKWLATRHQPATGVPTSVQKTLQWEEIISDSEVDAVVIATPHDQHVEQIKACLLAGKHVLCEKPLALNATNAISLAKLCEEKGLVGMLDYSFRFIPSRALFQSVLEEGVIGSLRLLRLSFFRDDFNSWPNKWYYQRQHGGGAILSTGSHLIDAVHWLTKSKIKWVNAVVSTKEDIDVECSATMATDSGCICTVEISHRIPGAGKHVIEAQGTEGSLTLNANSQVIRVQTNHVQQYTPMPSHLRGFGESLWDGEPRLQPTARVVDLFVDHVLRSSATSPISFWTAATNQTVLDAIWISHSTGQRVAVQTLDHYKG